MEKWKKNLIINPKYISTVVDDETTDKFSATHVKKMVAEIKSNLKKEQIRKKNKLSTSILQKGSALNETSTT